MPPKVTVKLVLEEPELQGAIVLAGEAGLDREVKAVTVAEILDIAFYLKGGDFVHSVASFMDEHSENQLSVEALCEWTQNLIDHGASCLAIKTKRYLKEIPAPLLQLGNENDFPIIELPPGDTQNDVTQCVLRVVMEAEEQGKNRSLTALSNLHDAVVNGASIVDISRIFAGYLNNPVLIEDHEWRYVTCCDNQSAGAAEALLARRREENLQVIVDHIVGESSIRTQVVMDNRTIWQETWPIIFKENVIGYFSICEYEGSITSENRQLVERCLDILALTIYHHQSYIDSTAWHTGEVFLQALLAENYQKEVVSYFAQMMGFDEQKNMSAIVISPISKAQKEQFNSKNWSKYHYFTEYAVHSIQSFIAQKNFKVILGGYYGFLVVFVDTGSKGIRDMKRIGMSIWESLTGGRMKMDVVMGIGCIDKGIPSYRESCLEALDVVRCIRRFGLKENVMCYDELGHYALLNSILRKDEAALRYSQTVLGKLYNDKDADELVSTLSTYLDKNCSYVETSRALFLHVNTVKYRIKQIQERLSVDLSTQDGRCSIWLALSIDRYLK